MKASKKKRSDSVVGKGSKPGAATVGTVSHFRLSKKLILVMVGVVVLAAIIAVIIVATSSNKSNPKTMAICTTKQTNNIAMEASGVLAPQQSQQLQKVVDRIQKIPDYEKDPNCLFPITQYYINRNDQPNATAYYNKMAAVYDAKAGFYVYYRGYAKNLDDVKKALNQVVQYNQQIQKNVRYIK